ncbi:MAG TPA: cyclopropane-fatty-acyl-phospholipid synthase family protein [Alphaproteobacteria bacterium]|nr:cyclopropane-fatty-acyl-phospholipid synthase family protein [Alphaproteobacteria bacterium]
MLASHFLSTLMTEGQLTVIAADGKRHVFAGRPGPAVTVRLHDSALHHRLLFNPRLALGEAYMEGTLTIENASLYELLDLLALNVTAYEARPSRRVVAGLQRALRAIHTHNPVPRAHRNVAHHYDLSGTLYDLFLDRDRQYSCAYFVHGTETLEQAQESKKLHLASKLLLKPGQKLLDIGSGWGGLALYLARLAGVDATGITLSSEQHKVANERARENGLADRVRFHLRDYRAETGRYDRIVSVGMFEHVGPTYYGVFFAKVRDLLAEDGVALLHSIGRMEMPGGTNPWLRKYIFPGGYTPALSEALIAIERVGLFITDIEILRLHYAETLSHWRRRFEANRERIRAIYDERFCRMWEFYLIGCEIAFRRLNQMVFQIQVARRQETVPLTRDYMFDFERAHGERAPAAAAAAE